MLDHKLTVSVSDTLLRAARNVADAREISLQQLIRDALNTEVARFHRKAKSPARADERTLAMLRARFAKDFAYAHSWSDLITRLRQHHVSLREAGGGLILVSLTSGARLCKASDMGASIGQLARRFGEPFPGDKLGRRYHYASTTHPDEVDIFDPHLTRNT